jgi:hypothetical protein
MGQNAVSQSEKSIHETLEKSRALTLRRKVWGWTSADQNNVIQ